MYFLPQRFNIRGLPSLRNIKLYTIFFAFTIILTPRPAFELINTPSIEITSLNWHFGLYCKPYQSNKHFALYTPFVDHYLPSVFYNVLSQVRIETLTTETIIVYSILSYNYKVF